jgi:hypothetical protein
MTKQRASCSFVFFVIVAFVDAFVSQHDLVPSKSTTQLNSLWDGISSLWEEIIEISTYGPSERKLLQKQRERQREIQKEFSKQLDSDSSDEDAILELVINDDKAWLEAFAAAKDKDETKNDDTNENRLGFDGYALRDLFVAKWGVPLDVELQPIGNKIYCTVLPMVGYGSPLKSRHDSELEYLMHLQGVVEVLHKYGNLELFVGFVETTHKVPKRGTDAVLFKLNLSKAEIDRIVKS